VNTRIYSLIMIAVLALFAIPASTTDAQVLDYRTDYAAGDSPHELAIGDLNGDSSPDMALSNFTSGNVSVLLSNGDGTFQAAVDYPCGNQPYGVAHILPIGGRDTPMWPPGKATA
jgi:hypothetical protein